VTSSTRAKKKGRHSGRSKRPATAVSALSKLERATAAHGGGGRLLVKRGGGGWGRSHGKGGESRESAPPGCTRGKERVKPPEPVERRACGQSDWQEKRSLQRWPQLGGEDTNRAKTPVCAHASLGRGTVPFSSSRRGGRSPSGRSGKAAVSHQGKKKAAVNQKALAAAFWLKKKRRLFLKTGSASEEDPQPPSGSASMAAQKAGICLSQRGNRSIMRGKGSARTVRPCRVLKGKRSTRDSSKAVDLENSRGRDPIFT